MPTATSPIRIAIIAMPETSASVVYGMYDLFMSAGRDWGLIVDGHPAAPLIQVQVLSAHGASFTAGNGVRITPDATLAACHGAEVVCMPELLVPPGQPLEGRFTAEIDCLKQCYEAGAILLAEAGLLDGWEATTYWAYCDIMTRCYPKITVRGQRALVASGEGRRLIMAGGGTTWLDLTLYLISRLVSVDVAMQVARVNLIDWHHIGQQPFTRLARASQSEDAVIARCQAWIAEHYATASPGNQPIEAIANEVGYEDPGFFSRLFKQHVNLTPAQYRKRFGAMRGR